MPTPSGNDLSPQARREKLGLWLIKALKDVQELLSRQVETMVVLAEARPNGQVVEVGPIYLESIGFMEGKRKALTGIVYRVSELGEYAVFTGSPENFVGFYIVPSGGRLAD